MLGEARVARVVYVSDVTVNPYVLGAEEAWLSSDMVFCSKRLFIAICRILKLYKQYTKSKQLADGQADPEEELAESRVGQKLSGAHGRQHVFSWNDGMNLIKKCNIGGDVSSKEPTLGGPWISFAVPSFRTDSDRCNSFQLRANAQIRPVFQLRLS